jgi:hypothetical protein
MSVFWNNFEKEITQKDLREFFAEGNTQRIQEFSFFKMDNCQKKKIPHRLS